MTKWLIAIRSIKTPTTPQKTIETEALCAAFEQGWVTDETNESDAYARNRLRHGAVPALRSVNAAAEENLARFCEKAARADAYFARQAEQLLSHTSKKISEIAQETGFADEGSFIQHFENTMLNPQKLSKRYHSKPIFPPGIVSFPQNSGQSCHIFSTASMVF